MHIIFDFLETITEWIRPYTKDIGIVVGGFLFIAFLAQRVKHI